MYTGIAAMEKSMTVPPKIKNRIITSSAIPLWVDTQKNWSQGLRERCVHPHSSHMIHNSQEIEATQMSTDR